jgi:fluoride exporter
MLKILLIAVGGGAGAVLRFLVAGWGQRLTTGVFPVGTLTVNVGGCLAIGFLGAIFAGPWLVREEYRLAATVGLLGGLTTFSTYGLETVSMANDGQVEMALLNILASNALGLFAVWLGYRVAENWFGV